MLVIDHICDPAWENSAYVHTKFDDFFRILIFNNLLSKHSVYSNETFV